MGLVVWVGQMALASVEEARQLFDQGKYNEGQNILFTGLRRSSSSVDEKAAMYAELARFYEDLVGDPIMARVYWKKLGNLDLPETHPLKQQSAQRIEEIEREQVAFRPVYTALKNASMRSGAPEEMAARLSTLDRLLEEHPDFPGVAHLHYWRGHHLAALNRQSQAIQAFNEALSIKPALGLILPVISGRDLAKQALRRKTIPPAAWSVTALTLGILLFNAIRIQRRHAIDVSRLKPALILLLGWVGVFAVLTLILQLAHLDHKDVPFNKPILLKTNWFEAGGLRVASLFGIGLVISVAIYLAALATVHWRQTWGRIGLMLALTWGLGGALAAGHVEIFMREETVLLKGHAPFGVLYSRHELNSHELPETREQLIEMLSNATPQEMRDLLYYHLPNEEFDYLVRMPAEELADRLMPETK